MKQQRGFGLIELLVGLVMGVLVLMAAYSVAIYFDNTKRTSVSGNSALANAITGLNAISHELRLAGLGLVSNQSLVCTTLNAYYNATISNGATLAPVVIQDNGTNPDTVSIFYGNSSNSAVSANLINNMASPDDLITVNAGAAFTVNNLALLSDPVAGSPCTLIAVTQVVNDGVTMTLSHDTTSPFNPAAMSAAYATPVSYPATNSLLLNLGTVNWATYSIANNTLQRQDRFTGTAIPLADNIVGLHAQYGVTDGTSQTISQWTEATGGFAALTPTNIHQVRAIRIAVIARSNIPEKPSNGAGACNATTAAPVPWVGAAAVDLSANPNWQCYRYKVVKTIIPLKNILWGGVT